MALSPSPVITHILIPESGNEWDRFLWPMESKIWVKGHHCESAVGMAVSPPCSERLGHPAFHASCGPLSRPHSPLHHQVSGKLPRLPQLHICWVQSPRGRPSILYGYKDGPRHGQDGVAVIWNTRTAKDNSICVLPLQGTFNLYPPDASWSHRNICCCSWTCVYTQRFLTSLAPLLPEQLGSLKKDAFFLSALASHWCRTACFI